MMDLMRAAPEQVNRDLASIAERLRRSTVQIRARGGHGSGLIASANGTVVTNAHVAGGRKIRVILADGSDVRSEVIARASNRDLAAIRVEASGLPAVTFRDARTLRPGDMVVAVGNPLDLVGAVTAGIVHSADRRGRSVVADVRLLPGNSGGPLADAEGRIVGVNAMVVDGLAVAIAAEVVKRFLAAPNAQPYIGVVTQPVVVPVMGERRMGLLILETADAGAAVRAGLFAGDVVIGVDGRLFSSPAELPEAVETAAVGDRIRLDIVRAGRVTGIDVIVGDAARAADFAA
jgi:serine protease Do